MRLNISLQFISVNLIPTMCHVMKPLIEQFSRRQEVYKEVIHRLVNNDARTIVARFNWTHISLSMTTKNKKEGSYQFYYRTAKFAL